MITASIRTTTFCQYNCSHCFIPEKIRQDKTILSLKTFNKIIDLIVHAINQSKNQSENNELRLLWTGGEPLHLPASFYFKLGALLDRRFQESQIKNFQLHESMQTSLLPVNIDHITLFKERFQGKIGSSLDFTQRSLNGSIEKYHEVWLDKYFFLKKYSIEVIPVITPTKKDIKKVHEIYQWFLNNEIYHIMLSTYIAPPLPTNYDEIPTNRERSQLYCDFFDITMDRLENNKPVLYNNIISNEIFRAIIPLQKQKVAAGCQHGMLVFEPSGTVSTCPILSYCSPPIGNIHQSSNDSLNDNLNDRLNNILRSSQRLKQLRFQKVEYNAYQRCINCEFYRVCKRGCIARRNDCMHDDCGQNRIFLRHVVTYCNQSLQHRKRALQYANTALPEDRRFIKPKLIKTDL